MTDNTNTVPFAGEHEACVIHVVRAGKHTPKRDKFNKGSTPRLWVTYELLDDQNDKGSNRWLTGFNFNEPFNNYYTDKGAQADWLSTFTNARNSDDALREVCGAPCWVDVKHIDGKGSFEGRVFANFDGVGKWRARDGEPKKAMNDPVFFDFYNPNEEDYKALPFWIRNYMKEADDAEESGFLAVVKEWDDQLDADYKASQDGNGTPQTKQAPVVTRKASEDEFGSIDDDIPF